MPVNVSYHDSGVELADIVTRFGIRAMVLNSDFTAVLADAAGRVQLSTTFSPSTATIVSARLRGPLSMSARTS